MKLAHNVVTSEDFDNVGRHSNYHSIEQIRQCNDLIGFDGIYENVYNNRKCFEGKSGILFIMGNYVGKDNQFDLPYVPRLEKYCTWEQLETIRNEYAFTWGWHTWSHPDLTTLSRAEIMREIIAPFPCKTFAYPYGRYNDLVIECVKEAGYEFAYSVTQGSTNPNEIDYNYKIYRNYI